MVTGCLWLVYRDYLLTPEKEYYVNEKCFIGNSAVLEYNFCEQEMSTEALAVLALNIGDFLLFWQHSHKNKGKVFSLISYLKWASNKVVGNNSKGIIWVVEICVFKPCYKYSGDLLFFWEYFRSEIWLSGSAVDVGRYIYIVQSPAFTSNCEQLNYFECFGGGFGSSFLQTS